MQPFYGSHRAAATLRADASSDPVRPFVLVEAVELHDDRTTRIRETIVHATESQARGLADRRAVQVAGGNASLGFAVQVFADHVPVHFAGGRV